jgi:hypothetical protein
MRNDIFEMRRDPQRREQADSLVVGKSSSAKISLQQENWYLARIEIVKDRMRVWLDGQSVGELVSSGLAHETKSSFHFTVSGDGVNFDDVKIWAIRD